MIYTEDSSSDEGETTDHKSGRPTDHGTGRPRFHLGSASSPNNLINNTYRQEDVRLRDSGDAIKVKGLEDSNRPSDVVDLVKARGSDEVFTQNKSPIDVPALQDKGQIKSEEPEGLKGTVVWDFVELERVDVIEAESVSFQWQHMECV